MSLIMTEEIVDDSNLIPDKTFHTSSDVEEDTIKNVNLKTSPKSYQILLMKETANDADLFQACQLFNVPVLVADDFQNEQQPEDVLSIYIVNSFDGVKKNGQNYAILGRTALLELAEEKQKQPTDEIDVFPALDRPLYCQALSGQVICFDGYQKNEDEDIEKLKSLILLVHHMGGSVREVANRKTTFVIAKLCEGDEYRYAATFGVSVVSETWVFDAWENRHIVGFRAADLNFVSKYKLKPFYRSRVCFLGFPEEEKHHMIEVLKENGGEPVDEDDSTCTHLVTNMPLNSLHLVSMVTYPYKRSFNISSPPPIRQDDASDFLIPTKKIKISPLNLEKYSKNNHHDKGKLFRQLYVLGVSKSNRRLKSNILNCLDQRCFALLKQFSKSKVDQNRQPDDCRMDVDDKFVSNEYELISNVVRGNEAALYTNDPTKINFHYDDGDVQNYSYDFNRPFPINVLFTDLSSLFAAWRRVLNLRAENPAFFKRVVEGSEISSLPQLKSNKIFIVNVEWFWTSVQHEYRQRELDYKIGGICNGSNVTPLNLTNTQVRSASSTRNRKRKRLKDKLSVSCEPLLTRQSAQKRRSSTSDVTRLPDDSFLDFTTSPDIVDADALSPSQDKSKNTTRYHKFVELCQTETNYVRILKIIMTLFKEALENLVDDKNGQLLNATELKIIFGHLPPIYSTHCLMLEELKQMAARWNEDSSIGSLILKYSGDLLKAYPPFINFFENTRDMLIKCDRTKPRFHAFLKVCQSKPECGRQSLQDLLIRPVQRLPSINLLLNDILRYTTKTSIDFNALEAAIVSIQDVMAHINEDKRKTEGQVALFDIFNDIEHCPAHLVSSQRCFISRCEVTELSDNLSGKGNPLVLFLFSDVIEVCKKRTKAFNNLKSPKENGGSLSSRHGNAKLYKHVKLLPLSAVLKVFDVKETEDCHNIFALMVKSCHELKESKNTVYSFTVTDETIEKKKYLHILCNQIAQVFCQTDTESYLTCLEGEQLDIVSSEVTTGTLGKAFNKFAAKTRIKVGRALSFNKTPNKIKRAVSNMISPFASQSALIASSHLANLQLAALPAIPKSLKANTLPETPTSATELSRKTKSSSFSMGSLLRL